MTHRIASCVGLVLFAATTLADPPPQRHYTVTSIPIADYDAGSIYQLNDAGQAIGVRVRILGPGNWDWYGFFWSRQTGIVELGRNFRPFSLNNNGVVVGDHYDRDKGHATFRWSLGSAPEFLGLESVRAINDAGQILASTRTSNWNLRGVVINPDGTSRTLPLPQDGTDVFAMTLTPSGTVTGWIDHGDEDHRQIHAAIWPATGGFELLGGLPGWEDHSFGLKLNAQWTVIGSSAVPDITPPHGMQRAVYWDLYHHIHDLGTLPGMLTSGTSDINDAGEIVGWSANYHADGTPWRAFLWTAAEGMMDLNDYIDEPGDHWTLNGAVSINQSGMIAANAWLDGHHAMVILEPQINSEKGPQFPEPSALLLFAGASCLLPRRRAG
jgi:probable HAF family extracellular repeat protein